MTTAVDKWPAAARLPAVASADHLPTAPTPLSGTRPQIAAKLAKIMAMMCVRNTKLEGLHAGVAPVSKTGDFSDVIVVDANGREIPWPEVSHFDNDAMRDLMRQIVNRLYTFQLKADDPQFQKIMDRWAAVARKWDDPEFDEAFLKAMEQYREMDDREGSFSGTPLD